MVGGLLKNLARGQIFFEYASPLSAHKHFYFVFTMVYFTVIVMPNLYNVVNNAVIQLISCTMPLPRLFGFSLADLFKFMGYLVCFLEFMRQVRILVLWK